MIDTKQQRAGCPDPTQPRPKQPRLPAPCCSAPPPAVHALLPPQPWPAPQWRGCGTAGPALQAAATPPPGLQAMTGGGRGLVGVAVALALSIGFCRAWDTVHGAKGMGRLPPGVEEPPQAPSTNKPSAPARAGYQHATRLPLWVPGLFCWGPAAPAPSAGLSGCPALSKAAARQQGCALLACFTHGRPAAQGGELSRSSDGVQAARRSMARELRQRFDATSHAMCSPATCPAPCRGRPRRQQPAAHSSTPRPAGQPCVVRGCALQP